MYLNLGSQFKMDMAVSILPYNSDEIKKHYENDFFPVFAKLSGNLASVYPLIKNLWGIINPTTHDNALGLNIDFTLNKDWDRINRAYPNIRRLSLNAQSLVHYPIGEVPNNIHVQLLDGIYCNFKVNNLVVLDSKKIKQQNKKNLLLKYKNFVGVVTKAPSDEVDSNVLVAFRKDEKHCIMSVKKEILIKVPECYRELSSNITKKSNNKSVITTNRTQLPSISTTTSKYNVGDVVKYNGASESNIKDLIGTVIEVINNTVYNHNSRQYKVNFNNLFNNSLLLSTKETSDSFNNEEYIIREWDLEGYNISICNMPHFLQSTFANKRGFGWSCKHQELIKVTTTAFPHKDSGEIEFEVLSDKGTKYNLFHYEIDYIYDESKLKATLKDCRWATFGVEDFHGSHDNYAPTSVVFLYLGFNDKNKVNLRIRLGTLNNTPHISKKFNKSIDKLKHPWQIYRYLKKNSLGFFYKIIKAKEYFGECDMNDFVEIT